jgi:hypothetical protein
MNSYLVVIGDLVDSKKLSKSVRKRTQHSLETVLKNINQESAHIISPYTITLGDEFQGVYQKADDLFQHLWAIMAEIHPVTVRVSIGVGEITTTINNEHTLGMDGPVFHKARERIDQMKKKEHLLSISTDNMRFDRLVNSTFRILGANLRGWNKNRFSILHKQYEGKDVKQIAGEVSLSEVAVYKNINAGTLQAIQDFTATVSETINEMLFTE